MSTLKLNKIHHTDRIGTDHTDLTQDNVSNMKYANHNLTNFVANRLSNDHVQFAIPQPAMTFNGLSNGNGLSGDSTHDESGLLLKTGQERPVEKLQLFQRPFITVPYLGRGSVDPTLESQLMQGEPIHEKKSVSTIMEKSFNDYRLFVLDDEAKDKATNPAYKVEEAALDGWVRGGMITREMTVEEAARKSKK